MRKKAIVRRRDAKLAVITLVRSRGHIIGATRSHDLPEASWPTTEPQRIIPKHQLEGPTEFSRFD